MRTDDRFAYAAWVAVCLIWGTTYLAIRITLETIPPDLMTGIRWTVAGLLLSGILVARGERLPALRAWGPLTLMGFLFIGLGNGAVVWAEQYVPSGLAAVLVGASPFWMAGSEAWLGGERLHRRGLMGLALGFAGIVLLVWPDLRSPVSAGFGLGVVALQVACIGWALGSSYSRRRTGHDNVLMVAAAQMLTGGAMMLMLGTLHGEWSALSFSSRTLSALVYLTIVGSIGGFAAYAYALKHLPVSLVSLYAYVNPMIAVALGVVIMGEPFSARIAIAGVIVFTGVALVRSKAPDGAQTPVIPARPEKLPSPTGQPGDAGRAAA